jgi:hypothetical protein
VHSPFEAKAELISRFRQKPAAGGHREATYAAMIASVDESVGRIVARLDELNLAEKTLVIFTSDNGGVGGYRGAGVDARSVTDNAPLHGGKGMLYEGGIRVPYIFRWPGVIKEGAVCDEPIASVDLFPTLLEIAAAEKPEGQVLDGTSYLALLKSGGAAGERPALYWHFPGYLGGRNGSWRTTPAGAIRDGDWKLLEFFEDGHRELYNLRDDPGESHNRGDKEHEKTAELHRRLVAWREQVGAKLPTPNKPRAAARQAPTFHAVRCDGTYPGHLQGISMNDRDAIYWSFTTALVKTDADGRVLEKIDAASHHGDLCFADGKVYVAVNLGLFNFPAGRADSWVYVYDADSLDELARHQRPRWFLGPAGSRCATEGFLSSAGCRRGSAKTTSMNTTARSSSRNGTCSAAVER